MAYKTHFTEDFYCTLTNWNAVLKGLGIEPMEAQEAQDWIVGGENMNELQSMAHDLYSEIQTGKAEEAHYKRFGDPIYGEPDSEGY
jgi:hypothetical protein